MRVEEERGGEVRERQVQRKGEGEDGGEEWKTEKEKKIEKLNLSLEIGVALWLYISLCCLSKFRYSPYVNNKIS